MVGSFPMESDLNCICAGGSNVAVRGVLIRSIDSKSSSSISDERVGREVMELT